MPDTRGSDREILGVEEVAEYLGVAPITVYRWCKEGRLPCVKFGRVWRVRRAALEEHFRRAERPATLVGQLEAFLTVPDHVIAIASDLRLLRRLDAAFFQVAEARGGSMVKFYAGEIATTDELRDELERNGLEARRLEAEGRMTVTEERRVGEDRAEALRELLEGRVEEGGTLWASFDWVEPVGVDDALREQEELAGLVGEGRLVVKSAVLQEVADEWPPAEQRRARDIHSGMIYISESRLSMSRSAPLPGA